jgi:hypothetical protein
MNHQKKASSERHGELWLRICNGLRSNPVLRNVCDEKEFENRKKEFVKQKTKQVKNIKKELKSEEAVTNGKPSKKPAPEPSYAEGANPLKLAERASSKLAGFKLGQVEPGHSKGSSHAPGLKSIGVKWLRAQPVYSYLV